MKRRRFFFVPGPGVITGAADDDPSGIATYSQAGAQFGFGLLWSMLWILPLQMAVQEACARIGAVKGKGIAAVLRENNSRFLLFCVVFLVLAANIINIGADIGAMASAVELIVPVNGTLTAVFFAILIVTLEIKLSYRVYTRILKWLCLFLLAYPATVLIVGIPWMTLLKATVWPQFELNRQWLFIVTGLLGTTISPYLFFWEAAEEAEESRVVSGKRIRAEDMQRLRQDNFWGMLLSQVGAWSIMVVAGAVLHVQGVTDIKSAAEAAAALEPLVHTFPHAGYLARLIFASGIIGLGLLAVPVLSGSAAYALGEACRWRVSLDLQFSEAHGFYGIIIVATGVGLLVNFWGINPVRALIYAAVINGVVAVPLIFVIARIAQSQKIMGQYRSGLLSRVFVRIAFCAMLAAAVMLISGYMGLF